MKLIIGDVFEVHRLGFLARVMALIGVTLLAAHLLGLLGTMQP